MPLTNAQFAALQLGYLSGADLMQFGPIQLLVQRNVLLPAQPQQGCNFAYSEVKSNLINRYDIVAELAKTAPTGDNADARDELCVKIVAIKAVENILAGSQNIGENLISLYKWADKTLLAIRNAQLNLSIAYPPVQGNDPTTNCPIPYTGDQARLIPSSFKWIG